MKQKAYFSSNALQIPLSNEKDTCTFLVPSSLVSFLEKSLSELGDFNGLLIFLLRKYRRFLANGELFQFHDSHHSIYQEKNQGLQKFNVRIDPEAWTRLGLLAFAHGISRCKLFSLLLWLESVRIEKHLVLFEPAGVPAYPMNLRMYIYLDYNRSLVYKTFEPHPDSVDFWNPLDLLEDS